MKLMQRLGLAALPLCLALACSIAANTPDQWMTMKAKAPTEDVIWEVALLAALDADYPLGAGVDPATRSATSGWRNSLAPFKGDGYRQRAHMRLEPQADGSYVVSLRVEKQTNEDLVRPMDLQYAKWEDAPDDVEATQILMTQIRARLGDQLEVGEKRSKLPAKPPPKQP